MNRRFAVNCYAGLLCNISEDDHYKYCSSFVCDAELDRLIRFMQFLRQ